MSLTPSQSRQPNAVKRFYFLEYFLILLKAVEKGASSAAAFETFLRLKKELMLGESKFRRKNIEIAEPTPEQQNRYRYTFRQVKAEAEQYGLLKENEDFLVATNKGIDLLERASINRQSFYKAIAQLIEREYQAFRELVETCYTGNEEYGTLIFPSYSPYDIGIPKSSLSRSSDVLAFVQILARRISADLQKSRIHFRASDRVDELISKLVESDLIARGAGQAFNPKYYNRILKRIRDFWISSLLQHYGYKHSITTFDIWTYRAKQAGIVQATESYPTQKGRIVYPTSIVKRSATSDFEFFFEYADQQSLWLHRPPETELSRFVDRVTQAYFYLRKTKRSHFVSLPAVRDIVCFRMKLSDDTFTSLINLAYRKNLHGELLIQMSLEVDRLPEETKAMYIRREPVTVDGRPRNLIGIKTRPKIDRPF